MITRHNEILTIVGVVLLFCTLQVQAEGLLPGNPPQEGPTNPAAGSIFEVLSGTEMLEITVTTDLVNLIDNRKREEYQEAVMTYEDEKGMEVLRNIKLKPRGKFRRRICEFPPVKVKFSKKDLEKEGLEREFNTLKLVTHCLDDKLAGKENVMKEYLAYQLFNQLTDKSFRTQLVRITYIDTSGKLGKIKRFGFLIENTDEMASRLGGTECECMNTPDSNLADGNENLMALFQYMIGNVDYSTVLNRNVKLVKPYSGGPMYTVPYDFDFAGIVDASYAVPNSDYGLLSVRDRAFIGNPSADEQFRRNIKLLKDKRIEFTEYILNFSPMAKIQRVEVIQYLDTFYSKLDELAVGNSKNLFEVFSNAHLAVPTAKPAGPAALNR